MQVFGSFTSPYVRHVRLVIEQTRTDCDFIETDAQGSAQGSPTMKVPYLRDGDIELTDSSSIIRYLREKSGQVFLHKTHDFDLFCMINTLLDSSVNLFLLEKNGLNINDNSYLKRQADRVNAGLQHLNTLGAGLLKNDQDVYYRLLSYIAWGQYRQRINLEGLGVLQALLKQAAGDELFIRTQPPA